MALISASRRESFLRLSSNQPKLQLLPRTALRLYVLADTICWGGTLSPGAAKLAELLGEGLCCAALLLQANWHAATLKDRTSMLTDPEFSAGREGRGS